LALDTQNYDAKDREGFEDANDHGNDGDAGESIDVTSWILDLSGPNLCGEVQFITGVERYMSA
jgi:hypothetical protein